MWYDFQSIGEDVARYSSVFGQGWYILTFIFRLIVVVSLGGSVFHDDRHLFQCTSYLNGCVLGCYQEYVQISYMKFWSLHMLALAVPTIAFQFYYMYKTGQAVILKKEKEEWKLKQKGGEKFKEMKKPDDYDWVFHEIKMNNRKAVLGKVEPKTIYQGKLDQIAVTTNIKIAYLISVFIRMILDVIFIYAAAQLYNHQDPHCNSYPESFTCANAGWWSWLWLTVPSQFMCRGPNVWSVCEQEFTYATFQKETITEFITCYIAQPYEKSIYLRYMQILACICFLLCVAELIYMPIMHIRAYMKKKQRKEARKAAGMNKKEVELTNVVSEKPSTSTSRKRSVSSKSKGAAATEKPSAASTSHVSVTKDQNVAVVKPVTNSTNNIYVTLKETTVAVVEKTEGKSPEKQLAEVLCGKTTTSGSIHGSLSSRATQRSKAASEMSSARSDVTATKRSGNKRPPPPPPKLVYNRWMA